MASLRVCTLVNLIKLNNISFVHIVECNKQRNKRVSLSKSNFQIIPDLRILQMHLRLLEAAALER